MSRHFCLLAVAALSWTLLPSSVASAQTIDITGMLLPPGQATVFDFAEVHRWRELLNKRVRTAPFQKEQSLKEALIGLYEMLSAEGKELPIVIDEDAVKAAHPLAGDIYQATVRLPNHPRTMTVAGLLQALLKQLPHRSATFKVHTRHDFLELTAGPKAKDHVPMPPLDAVIDVSNLHDERDLLSALGSLRSSNPGDAPLVFVVDHEAFKRANPQVDLDQITLRIPLWVRRVTLRDFLKSALQNLAGGNATFVTAPGFIGITTSDRAPLFQQQLESALAIEGMQCSYTMDVVGWRR